MAEIIAIAMILLFGTLCSALAYRLKVSNVFFLILAGMVFGIFNLIDFSSSVIIVIAELTLIMVVFDATSKCNFRKVLKLSRESMKLTWVSLAITLISVIPLSLLFFDFNNSFSISILLAGLLAVLVYGIDPAVALSVLKGKTNRVMQILEIEAIINTPITVVLALLILKLVKEGTQSGLLSGQVIAFLQQIFVPVGVGVALGFMIVNIMKHNYFEELSHLLVITSAVIVYVLSELLGGNGVLAVTTFGLIFGNYHIDHKIELEKFASIFANTLKILVFVLVGTVIVNSSHYRTFDELLFGTLLFFVYLLIRYISVYITLKKETSFREKLFMTLNVPKGIDVAVVVLLVISSVSSVEGISIVKNISLLFILYSVVVATVSSLFNDWFFEKGSSKK